MSFEALFGRPSMMTSSDVILYLLSAQASTEPHSSAALSEFGNGLTIAQEMENLRHDLVRLENGWTPTNEELASAPELKDWGVLDTGDALPRILGYLAGASKLGSAVAEGARMMTLHVLARDKDATWVRDRRGFYRLERISCNIIDCRHAPYPRKRRTGSSAMAAPSPDRQLCPLK